jgi:proline iminopeptidase
MRPIFIIILCFAGILANAQDFGELLPINGTKIYVTAKGEGEPLLVIHGGPGLNHSYFIPYLEGLEKNFKVIYYDQRASGKSAIPGQDSVSIKFMVDDIEAIRKHLNLKKINILAHSWGAVLAASYGSDYTNNVNTLILSNPSPLSREYDAEIMQLSKKRISAADSTARGVLLKSGMKTPAEYEQLMKLTFKMSAFNRSNMDKINFNIPENFTNANRSLFGGLMRDPSFQKNFYNDLKKFDFPVLIVTGELDILSDSAIQRLRSSLPKSRIESFTESGHFPFVEETRKFNKVVGQFIKKKQ